MTLVEVQTVREAPPAIWLEDCTRYLDSITLVETNGDLAVIVPDLVSALLQCDRDKNALRDWADTQAQTDDET